MGIAEKTTKSKTYCKYQFVFSCTAEGETQNNSVSAGACKNIISRINNIVGAFYEKGIWEYGAASLCSLLTTSANSNLKISEPKIKKISVGKLSDALLSTTAMNVLLNKTMKPQFMYVYKLTAAVVMYALRQCVLLQQAPNIDFHIGGLCDMKTENISLQ